MPGIAQNSLLINANELGKLLGLGRTKVYEMKKSGQLPCPVKIGGSVRWRREEVEAWVAAGCPPLRAWEMRSR